MSNRVLGWLALATVTAACGGDALPPAPTATTDSVAVARILATAPLGGSTRPSSVAATPADSASKAAPLSPTAFRHEKHRGLVCQRCHPAVPGHARHTNVACTSCHPAVPVTGPAPGPAECGGCHHAAVQGRACTSCHDPTARGTLALQRSWDLSVWGAPRLRDVKFDHRWHEARPCGACHTDRPSLVSTRACASCHEHHEGRADCRICHVAPPVGVHTLAAHQGCAGQGCHRDPPVRKATLSRDECLLCHADRERHQPGRACAQCHMPQAAARAPPAGREPTSP